MEWRILPTCEAMRLETRRGRSELARRGLFGFSDIRRTAASEMERSEIELGMAGLRVDDKLRNKLACGGVCGSSDIRRAAASEMTHRGIELGMAGPRVDDQLKSELARRGLLGFSDIRRAAASEMTPSGIEPGMAGLRVDDIFHPNRIFLSALPFRFSLISYIIGKTGILFPQK